LSKTALITALILSAGAAHAAPVVEDLPDPPAPVTPPAPSRPPSSPDSAPLSRPPAPEAPPAAPPGGPPSAAAAAAVAPAAPTLEAIPDDKLPPLPVPKAPAGPVIELAPEAAGAAAPPAAADPELGQGRRLTIGGYGEAQLFFKGDGSDIDARLRRFVLFLGHRFSDWLRVYTETEVEDGTTLEMEQAYLDIIPDPHFGVRAGLMLVPLGIINRLHEPPTYLTVDRPLTDQIIIPSTWRELGVGLFGELGGGTSYELAVASGLDPTAFSAMAPLAGTGGNGREVAVHDPALVARLDFAGLMGLDVGVGGYLGWARGGHPELAGVRAAVAEGDVRYHHAGIDVRAEYAHVFIIDSYRLNDYFGLVGDAAIPARARGFYVQAGYDLFHWLLPDSTQELVLFAGYENVNPRSRMSPYNFNPPAITGPNQTVPNSPALSQGFVRTGLTYRPHPQVALKLDVQLALDGEAAAPTSAPLPGALGVQKPLSSDVAEAARGGSRVGMAVAFMF
jgi:hypothetical protein